MGNQIQQLQIQGLIRIAGRCLLAGAFALLVIVSAGGAPGRQSPDRQSSRAPKSKSQARTLSGSEISEARELLHQLGYWINPAAKGNDISLRHALIAFQKIEGRKRSGVLTIDELEALRGAQKPRT